MPAIVPCLWFDGQAQQAAEHYVSIFPDSRITEVTRVPPGVPMPEGSVLTVSFVLSGQEYVALNGGPQFSFTEAISLQIHTTGQEETDHYWNRLSEGGEEGPCAWLKDRYGLSWQVVPTELLELTKDPDAGRAGRATQAMLGMSKIDIAELYRAADAVPA